MDLPIQNVINISVSQSPKGLANYNTSNLALFTREPYALGAMSNGYELFLTSLDVGPVMGTTSLSKKIADAVFSQSKNIRTGGGYLAIIAMLAPTQILSLDNVPDTGTIDLAYDGGTAVNFSVGDLTDADAFTAKLRTIAGLENAIGSISEDGLLLSVEFVGYEIVPVLLVASNNTLEASSTPVTLTPSQGRGLETLLEAMQRTEDLVPYFGVIYDKLADETTLPDEASHIQTLRKMYFPVSDDKAYAEEDGAFDLVRQASQENTRCLLHTNSEEEAILMASAYASRALSTNFSGSNTTQTMHLKDLVGVLPDDGISQSDLIEYGTTGVDVYVSIQGVPKVFTSGGNNFFDRVYNKLWFAGALEVAGFNLLARTSTKIAQTEEGIDQLLGEYRKICAQAVVNNYVSYGAWTLPDTFGDPETFRRNIEEVGYYLYAEPLALQSPTEREARQAPLIQIAIKEAGAVHSSAVIVNINA